MSWGYNPPIITSLVRPHPSDLAVREASHQFDDDSDGELHVTPRDQPARQSQSLTDCHNAAIGLRVVAGSQSALTMTVNSQSAPPQSINSQSAHTMTVNSQSALPKSINNQSAPPQSINSQSAPSQPINSQSALPQPINSRSAPPQPIDSQSALPQSINSQSARPQSINSQLALPQPINSQSALPQSINNQSVPPQSIYNQSALTKNSNSQSTILHSMDILTDSACCLSNGGDSLFLDIKQLISDSMNQGVDKLMEHHRQVPNSVIVSNSGVVGESCDVVSVVSSAETSGLLESTASTELGPYMADSDTAADETEISLDEEFADILSADPLNGPDILSSLSTSVLNELTHLDMPSTHSRGDANVFDNFDFMPSPRHMVFRRCDLEPLTSSSGQKVAHVAKGQNKSNTVSASSEVKPPLTSHDSTVVSSSITQPSCLTQSLKTSADQLLKNQPPIVYRSFPIAEQFSERESESLRSRQCSDVQPVIAADHSSTVQCQPGPSAPDRADSKSPEAGSVVADISVHETNSVPGDPASATGSVSGGLASVTGSVSGSLASAAGRKTPARRLSFTLDTPSPLLVEFLRKHRQQQCDSAQGADSVSASSTLSVLSRDSATLSVDSASGEVPLGWGRRLRRLSGRASRAVYGGPRRRHVHARCGRGSGLFRPRSSAVVHSTRTSPAHSPAPHTDQRRQPGGTLSSDRQPTSSRNGAPVVSPLRRVSASPGGSDTRRVMPDFHSSGHTVSDSALRHVQSSANGFPSSSLSSPGGTPSEQSLNSGQLEDGDDDGTITPSTGRCQSVSITTPVVSAHTDTLIDQLDRLYMDHARQLSEEISRHRRRRHLLESHLRRCENSVLEQLRQSVEDNIRSRRSMQYGQNTRLGSLTACNGANFTSTISSSLPSMRPVVPQRAPLPKDHPHACRLTDESTQVEGSITVPGVSAVGTRSAPTLIDGTALPDAATSLASSTTVTVSPRSTISSPYPSPLRSAQTSDSHTVDTAVRLHVSSDNAPLPACRRAAAASSSCLVVVPPEALRSPRLHRCFSRVSAAVRGYLTRRLLATDKVQSVIYTAREAMRCALRLQQEVESGQQGGAAPGVSRQDLQLYERLINQVYGACHTLHQLFIDAPVTERLAVIAADRAACLLSRTCEEQDLTSPCMSDQQPRLSRATLQRRKARTALQSTTVSLRQNNRTAARPDFTAKRHYRRPQSSWRRGGVNLTCPSHQQGVTLKTSQHPLHQRPWH